MIKLKKSSHRLFPSSAPQCYATVQVEDWMRGIVRNSGELKDALEILRDSYCAILAGHPATHSEDILAQVEAILKNTERAWLEMLEYLITSHRSGQAERSERQDKCY
jgi:hypothetical protein